MLNVCLILPTSLYISPHHALFSFQSYIIIIFLDYLLEYCIPRQLVDRLRSYEFSIHREHRRLVIVHSHRTVRCSAKSSRLYLSNCCKLMQHLRIPALYKLHPRLVCPTVDYRSIPRPCYGKPEPDPHWNKFLHLNELLEIKYLISIPVNLQYLLLQHYLTVRGVRSSNVFISLLLVNNQI